MITIIYTIIAILYFGMAICAYEKFAKHEWSDEIVGNYSKFVIEFTQIITALFWPITILYGYFLIFRQKGDKDD